MHNYIQFHTIKLLQGQLIPLHTSADYSSTELMFLFIFRWFKFTLKPPYSIAHDKL